MCNGSDDNQPSKLRDSPEGKQLKVIDEVKEMEELIHKVENMKTLSITSQKQN